MKLLFVFVFLSVAFVSCVEDAKREPATFEPAMEASYEDNENSYYENGQLESEKTYNNGVETYKEYYENGQLYLVTNYKDGKEDGVRKSWHESGQLKEEGFFNNGKRNGLYKNWYENGQLELEEEYNNGINVNSVKKWYKNVAFPIPFGPLKSKVFGISFFSKSVIKVLK